MNMAARMKAKSEDSKVLISTGMAHALEQSMRGMAAPPLTLVARNPMNIKGKGMCVTYWAEKGVGFQGLDASNDNQRSSLSNSTGSTGSNANIKRSKVAPQILPPLHAVAPAVDVVSDSSIRRTSTPLER
jgi:hypothetical protein